MKACSRTQTRRFRARPARFLAGLLFWIALLGAAPARAELFVADSFTLPNGLEVVVLPKHLAPVVYQILVYKAGAADGAIGKNGVAHFLEHLMFKGTARFGDGEFTRQVNLHGGEDNAFTNQDVTAFHQTIAKPDLPMIMEMEADRMTGLQLSDPVVLPERDVIIEERHQRIENDPGSQLSEMLNAVLYLNHPYRLPVIGWKHEMETYTTKDALDFYQSHYAPNNAVLVIAGDVTTDEVKALAEKYYGPIAKKDIPARQRLSEPQAYAPRRVTLESEFVSQPSVSRIYQAPSYRTAQGDQAYALQVLDEILGGNNVGRLYRRLVVEQALADYVGSSYDPSAYDVGSFAFWGAPRQGVTVEKIEQAIDDEIAKVLKDGVTDQEVADAKRRLEISAVKSRDSLSGAATLVATRIATGSTLAEIQSWPDRIGAVTAADVEAAARLVLVPNNSATGLLLPKPGAPAGQAPAQPPAPIGGGIQ
ncbi:MAG TPA: pitrilysin family protein [Dongiaceae bacterium]|nr:pitrilysin family protein [Dongiaceae bacterium]